MIKLIQIAAAYSQHDDDHNIRMSRAPKGITGQKLCVSMMCAVLREPPQVDDQR